MIGVCVCVCTYIHVHVNEDICVPVHMWTLKDKLGNWSSLSTLFKTGSFHCLPLHSMGQLASEFQKYPCITSCHRRTRTTCLQYCIQLYMGFGDPNLGPQECKAKLYPLSISPAHNILSLIQLVLRCIAW